MARKVPHFRRRFPPGNLFLSHARERPLNGEARSTVLIEPMYAQLCRELPDGGAWLYEAKLDGYRCLAAKRDNQVVL